MATLTIRQGSRAGRDKKRYAALLRAPKSRSEDYSNRSNYRIYSEDKVLRVRFVKRAQELEVVRASGHSCCALLRRA